MPRPQSDFTATEKRILDLLSDGMGHTKAEVFDCLDDELAGDKAVNFHLYNLRNKLKPMGIGIRSERDNGTTYFRKVRYVGKSHE